MARITAAELAYRLGRHAEAVCRHYLSNGKRSGNYWQVGDVYNTPGRSMIVRLRDSAKGPSGKWTDLASGEHGDLLDVIGASCGLVDFKDVADEARRFLSLPLSELQPQQTLATRKSSPAPAGSPEASQRLFAMSRPIAGTLAETYLRHRGINARYDIGALRFHPRCYYRPDEHAPAETWPAMIAAVTDLTGQQAGVHRTWLALDGSGKAPLETPRRAMGDLFGHGVRFGNADDVLAAGEGIETVLSPRMVLPRLPMLAALSATHLAAILFPASLRRLYVLRDRDRAGDVARDSLLQRAVSVGIEAISLTPVLEDFNEDLRRRGIDALRAALKVQLHPDDASRFLECEDGSAGR